MSVSFIQCFLLLFMWALLLPKGQTKVPMKFTKNNSLLQNWKHCTDKNIHFLISKAMSLIRAVRLQPLISAALLHHRANPFGIYGGQSGQGFLRVFWFSSVSITPPILCTHFQGHHFLLVCVVGLPSFPSLHILVTVLCSIWLSEVTTCVTAFSNLLFRGLARVWRISLRHPALQLITTPCFCVIFMKEHMTLCLNRTSCLRVVT